MLFAPRPGQRLPEWPSSTRNLGYLGGTGVSKGFLDLQCMLYKCLWGSCIGISLGFLPECALELLRDWPSGFRALSGSSIGLLCFLGGFVVGYLTSTPI